MRRPSRPRIARHTSHETDSEFMGDIVDDAEKLQAEWLARSLQHQSAVSANTVHPTPVGYCLNRDCEAPFEPGSVRLFCGPTCAVRFEFLLNH